MLSLDFIFGSGNKGKILSEKNKDLRFALYNNDYIVAITLASQHLFGVTLCQTLYWVLYVYHITYTL